MPKIAGEPSRNGQMKHASQREERAGVILNRSEFAATPPPAGEQDFLELAYSTDLIPQVQKDLVSMGLIGESESGLLIWIVYTSRHRSKPLSAIIKGPSGSGKDEIQRRPAELMPPEDVIDAMSITPQALYYGEPGWLEHKIVLGGERSHQDDDAQRDRTAAIRQMLSHGAITKRTVLEGRGQEIRQEGPISYSETTTKQSVFREDGNRVFQLVTNASVEQTRNIMLARAGQYVPGQDKVVTSEERKQIRERHHDFQRSLKDCDVRIPYAPELAQAMPTAKIDVRRIFGHILTLIEVIAFVHQHQRERSDNNELLATYADYSLARRLLLGPLHEAIGVGHEHEKMKVFADKLPVGKFTSKQAESAMETNSRKMTQSWLKKLSDNGAIRLVAEGKGNQPSVWMKTGVSVDEFLLPTVQTIQKLRSRVT